MESDEDYLAKIGDEYKTKIFRILKNNWEVPTLIPEEERLSLHAILIVHIEPSGEIKKVWFEKHSGNPVFDFAIENVIRNNAPFPPTPKELAKSYEKNGIGVPFTAGLPRNSVSCGTGPATLNPTISCGFRFQ